MSVLAIDIHPIRKCGPCVLGCKPHPATAYFHLAQKKGKYQDFYNWVHSKHPSVKDDDCICRRCEIQLKRTMVSKSSDEPMSKKIKVDMGKCVINNTDCDMARLHTCSFATGDDIHQCFNIQCNITQAPVLCHVHYNRLWNFTRQERCAVCDVYLTPGSGYLAHEIWHMEGYAKSQEVTQRLGELNLEVRDHSFICGSCRANMYRWSKGDDDSKAKSKDYLRTLLKPYENNICNSVGDVISYSLAEVIRFVGNKILLQDRVILLSEIVEKYNNYANDVVQEKGYKKEQVCDLHINRSSQWLLNRINMALKPCICSHVSSGKSLGTLLYRTGTDLEECLHAVYAEYKGKTKQQDDIIFSLNKTIEELVDPGSEAFHVKLNTILAQLRLSLGKYIRSQIARSKEVELDNIDFLSEVREIDPIVWNFFTRLTFSVKEEREFYSSVNFEWGSHFMQGLYDSEDFNRNRLLRRLFIISCLAFTTNDQCNYPCHLALCDVVDKYTNSSRDCVEILNRFGLITSKDTHLRHVTEICKGKLDNSLPWKGDSFVTLSVDNIDKLSSYAAVTADQQQRSFHGTSIQAVDALPSSQLGDGDTTQFYKESFDSTLGHRLKEVGCVQDNNSFYRAIAAHFNNNLKVCSRSSDGTVTNLTVQEEEAMLTHTLRDHVSNLLYKSLDYLNTLPEEHLSPLLDESVGPFINIQHRIEKMCNGSQVGDLEIMMTSFALCSVIHVYVKVNNFLVNTASYGVGCDRFHLLPSINILRVHNGYKLLITQEHMTDGRSLLSGGKERDVFLEDVHREADIDTTAIEYTFPSVIGQYVFGKQSKSVCIPIKTGQRERTIPKPMVLSAYPSTIDIQEGGLSVSNITPLSLQQFQLKEDEHHELSVLKSHVFKYVTEKVSASQLDYPLYLPGLKVYMSHVNDSVPEESSVYYLAVLDDPADSKETLLKVMSYLYDLLKVGKHLVYVVIVGDGKTYDYLMKLKTEYGDALRWVIPFIGDWHTLKNYQITLMKIYWDAGLKELASMFHKGRTLQSVAACTSFDKTHQFLLQVWEGMYRVQYDQFLKQSSENEVSHKLIEMVKSKLQSVEGTNIGINAKLADVKETILQSSVEFNDYLERQCERSITFRFWNRFVHTDMQAYIGLYLGVRGRNWNLRVASLKEMCPLFHAMDRTVYLKIISHHLREVLTLPESLHKHLLDGAFAVSIKGKVYSSVALDEAHEMCINKDVKAVMHSTLREALCKYIHYLPFRAKVLENIKSQLYPSRKSCTSVYSGPSVIINDEKNTVRYFEKLSNSAILDEGKTLIHLFTSQKATEQQQRDLLSIHNVGKVAMEDYIQTAFLHTSPKIHQVRKRRNLSTFANKKVSISKHKRELKDQKLVISCLRRQLASSKANSEPIKTLGRFVALPRAICTADGLPERGVKANMTKIIKNKYGEAFFTHLPNEVRASNDLCVVIEGMFMINTTPLGYHRTFNDYIDFLYKRWVLHFINIFGAKEVHIVFDHPERNGVSPKEIERLRRDCYLVGEDGKCDSITCESILPRSWHKFLQDRNQKRQVICLISEAFLCMGKTLNNQSLVLAGGFDNEKTDHAYVASGGKVSRVQDFDGNHEESDSRVWLHCRGTRCKYVLIYSPDTDTYWIGLPLEHAGKQVYVQLRARAWDNLYLHMNTLLTCIGSDINLQRIPCIYNVLQMLYIVSGCDYVSFFRGSGKKVFFDSFYSNAHFITGEGRSSLSQTDVVVGKQEGLLSFYRLIGAVYFQKHAVAFAAKTPEELFASFSNVSGIMGQHIQYLDHIREVQWARVDSEDGLMPSNRALEYHWWRCCWVSQLWSQADRGEVILQPLTCWGWDISSGQLEVVWDTQENISEVEAFVISIKKGCGCLKSRCMQNNCKCRKSGGYCQIGCRCRNCCNRPGVNQVIDDIDETEPGNDDIDEDIIVTGGIIEELDEDELSADECERLELVNEELDIGPETGVDSEMYDI